MSVTRFRALRACGACEAGFFSRINFFCQDGSNVISYTHMRNKHKIVFKKFLGLHCWLENIWLICVPAPCVSICCVWRARDDRVWSVGSSESVPRFAVGQWAKFQGFLSSVEWRGWSYLDGRFNDPTKHFHNNFIYYLLKKNQFPTYWIYHLLKGIRRKKLWI